jgi:hypothetical protein
MSGRVNQIQFIGLTIGGTVVHAHGVGFNRDPTFPFQVHIVQNLGLHMLRQQRVCALQQTVGQGRFTVIDMGNDRKIANMRDVHHVSWHVSRHVSWQISWMLGDSVRLSQRLRELEGMDHGRGR